MRTYLLAGLLFAFFIGLSLFSGGMQQATQAQTECSALITTGFSTLETSCSGVGGSSACFGQSAEATFADEADSAQFESPGDVVSLDQIQSIRTHGLDIESEEWGLALMNVPANVPLASSERGLVYMLMGDVEVENIVSFETAFTPVEPVTVTSLVGANIRSSPNTDARVVDNAPAGRELLADALSADQAWLRVLVDDSAAWISRQVIAVTDGDISTLPVISANTRSLMQSFILRTATDAHDCADIPPSMLIVQSPENLSANFTVNGVDLRLSSTVALQVLPGNVLQLITLDGGAYSGPVSVPAGLTMFMQLSEDGLSSAGPWRDQRAINDEERAYLLALEDFTSDTWHYVVNIPTQEEVASLLAQLRGAGGTGASGPAAGLVNCTNFRPTSPRDGLAFGPTTFFWDGAPGATHYRLQIVNASGNTVRTVEVPGQNTTLTTDTGPSGIGEGASFSWYVEALVDGQLACASPQVTLARSSGVVPAGGAGGSEPTPEPCQWC